jgi:5-methylcytosine-specific restriction endonuclease McrA
MARRRSARRWRRLREVVFARDGRTCALCGGYADTVDHVRPLALGGTDVPSNLRPLCRSCNCSRGARLGSRLAATGDRRVWPGAIDLGG